MGGKERKGRKKHVPAGYPIESLELTSVFTTISGRPLDEESTLHSAAAERTKFVYVRNVHPDSRGAFPDWPMNSTAMQEVTSNRKRISNDLAWLNQQYYGNEKPQMVTTKQAHELASIGVWMPAFLVFRAINPVRIREIPDNVGDLYKIAQGIQSATKVLQQEQGDTYPVTPEVIYEMADRMQPNKLPLLVNETVERVCPASEKIIRATAAVLLDGAEGNPAESDLGAYINVEEFSRLKDFSLASTIYIASIFDYFHEMDRRKILLAEGVTKDSFGQLVRVDRNKVATEMKALDDEFVRSRTILQRTFNTSLGRNPSNIMSDETIFAKHGLIR